MLVLIINRNRLTLPKAMAEWVAQRGCEPVFIDNFSDYPPLLEYYSKYDFRVERLTANYGHSVVWQLPELLDRLVGDDRYVITDPDLDLSGVPDDFIKVLNEGLDIFPCYDKCALSLEINDLPDSDEGNRVRNIYEAKYWRKPLNDRFYHADTDTTFALYREGIRHYSHSACRTARPYTAKHVPWYYLDFESLPEDEKYYFRTANDSSSGKKRLLP